MDSLRRDPRARAHLGRRAAWAVRLGAVAILLLPLANCSGGGDDGMVAASAERAPQQVTEADIVQVTATSRRVGDATVLSAESAARAQVTVPDAALQDGTAASAITAEVHAFDSPADGVAGVTFVLGPDGATFREPVLLEWDGPWSAGMSFVLRARHGDGTPIRDEGSPGANSIAALRISPTSPTTARYTLPVDHFSTWGVVASTADQRDMFGVGADVPDELAVGESVEVPVLVGLSARAWVCSGFLVRGDAVVSVTASTDLQCTDTSSSYLTLVVRCLAPGTGRIEAKLLAIAADGSGDDTVVPPGIRVQLLDSLFRMEAQARQGVVADSFDRSEHGLAGATFGISLAAVVRCVAPVTSAAGPSTSTSTSTAPGAGRRPAPDAAATGPTGTTGPTGPTGPAGAPTPRVTVPPTTAPPTTAPPTTLPSDQIIPTTTFPPDAPWGAPGTWSHNEYGSCDYNGSGGCGWYYGATRGTYFLGPLGDANATIPV